MLILYLATSVHPSQSQRGTNETRATTDDDETRATDDDAYAWLRCRILPTSSNGDGTTLYGSDANGISHGS